MPPLQPWWVRFVAEDRQDGEFCSTRDAADLLGVSLRTVQLWAEAGVLKAWKTAGGHRRITRKSVDVLLAQRAEALRARPVDARFRLLIVEDDPDFLRLYQLHVSGWNLPIDVTTANNGFEALVQLGSSRPDLMITDLRMPGMDGVEMIRALRAGTATRDIDIIVVTAFLDTALRERGDIPEDITILSKPMSFDVLRTHVASRIEAWSKHRA